jgi:hypothetical protein
VAQLCDDFQTGNSSKGKVLTAGKNGSGNFMNLGRCKNKDGMTRRFFQRFKQRIKSRVGQHVDFVDDIKLGARFTRSKTDLVTQIANVIHAGIGSRTDLDQIKQPSLVDGDADPALVTRALDAFFGQTVDRFGQQPGRTGFAGPARAGKQIRMGDSIQLQGIAKRLGHVLLPNHLIKCL